MRQLMSFAPGPLLEVVEVINEWRSPMSEQEEKVVSPVTETPAVETADEKAVDVMAGTVHKETDPVVSTTALLEAGAHFGHQTRRWEPKMKPYIYGIRNGLHIIDLSKTAANIQTAYMALKHIVENGGKVLFVGTKKQAADTILEEAVRSGSFYVNTRWLGGTLTNFKTISKRTKLLKNLEQMELDGVYETMPKKAAIDKKKQQEKLSYNLEGIKEMRKVPNAIVVVDPKVEHNAVAEAKILNIPIFAIMDTNCDPTQADYVIPCNDDGTKAIKLIVGLLADAVVEGKGGEVAYAYKVEGEALVSMNEALKGVDKTEELRLIKMKIREDSYALRNNGKVKKNKRVARKDPKPAAVETGAATPVQTAVTPEAKTGESEGK